jgi:hypothetical protein
MRWLVSANALFASMDTLNGLHHPCIQIWIFHFGRASRRNARKRLTLHAAGRHRACNATVLRCADIHVQYMTGQQVGHRQRYNAGTNLFALANCRER